MSEENVALVRAFVDAVNEGDWAAAFTEFSHDDVEIDWSRSEAPYRGIYRGRDGARRFGEFLDHWTAARLVPSDFIAAGDDVLVPHSVHFRGRDGIEVSVRATYVFTMRDGLCVRWRIHQELDEALKAAGLSDSPSD